VNRSIPRQRLAIAALTLAVAAAACTTSERSDDAVTADTPDQAPAPTTAGSPATTDPTAAPEAAATTTADADADPGPFEEAPAAVPAALQFTAPLVGGGSFDGATAAGKPTVFWFWAPT
jgi:hypothetical protein